MICSNKKQSVVIITIILIQGFSYDARSEDDSLSTRHRSRHLIYKVKVMLARNISKVYRSTAHASGCGVEARVIVDGLKHIPIRNDIQMLCEQSIMCVGPDMPWMAGWDFGKEVIRVSDENRWSVLGQLRVIEDLRCLRHA